MMTASLHQPHHYTSAIGLSIAAAVLLYLAGVVYSGWENVWSAMQRIGIGGIALALLLSMCNYAIRFARWQRYTKTLGRPLPWLANLEIYLAGFALTTTPGKSGELVRSLFLKRLGMGYAASVAAFVSERASDLMALLVLITAISITGGPTHPKAWLVTAAALGLLAVLILFLSKPVRICELQGWLEDKAWVKLAGWVRHASSLSANFRLCNRGRMFWWGTALGVLAWSAEGTGFFLIAALASNANIDWGQALFIYTFATLLGALSFLPGGLGTAEAAMFGLLVGSGAGPGEATAITVVARMATLWFGVSIGIAALAFASHMLAGKTA